ncbi:MAG: hypothetical protein IJT48_13240 [Bacteroidaceae bacterium]|nr:hypothetical protein [Bacteroidaceae bacterium]
MRIKRNSGHVVYSPLSYIFQVLEMGGSAMQKYDATTSSYIPNRRLTPLVLRPSLIISDPDGVVATADYVTQMNSVAWTVTLIQGSTSEVVPARVGDDDNYTVDSTTKVLRLYMNLPAGNVLHVKFSGKYTDTRRNEVQEFEWERDLGCEAQTDMNVTLDTGRWRGNVLLLPMKHWGQFGIPVQLMNGKDAIPDARCTYQWQWWTGSAWSEDFSERAWLVRGEQTKEIVVDQDYIQKVILRVKATAFGNNTTTQYWTTKLRRWYGQFDYDVEFLRGKYVFHDTDTVILNAWVANAKGQISHPCKYFDLELFFAVGNSGFDSVGYGEEAVITRNDLQTGAPRAGILCRELSAFRALALGDGKVLCTDEGTPIFAQFPTKSREV